MKRDLDALLEDPPPVALMLPWTLALIGVVCLLLLTGCASPRVKEQALLPPVRAALDEPARSKPPPLPPAVANALVPPADLSLPSLNGRTAEPRFDLNVVALPAAQVFAALAKGTRYSMLVDPSLTTPVTVDLKGVTLVEALDALRETYGFEYRVQGTRIFVRPSAFATRVFQVGYPIMTASRSGLLAQLESSLRLIVGAEANSDRQVIVSPQWGVVVVRALPKELRAVEAYLTAARLDDRSQLPDAGDLATRPHR